uniref:Uncharacterized protein n=1 Tax=Palpitomonas bilix TaxID=652834 RepID=A0A7S3G627_9EUKA
MGGCACRARYMWNTCLDCRNSFPPIHSSRSLCWGEREEGEEGEEDKSQRSVSVFVTSDERDVLVDGRMRSLCVLLTISSTLSLEDETYLAIIATNAHRCTTHVAKSNGATPVDCCVCQLVVSRNKRRIHQHKMS